MTEVLTVIGFAMIGICALLSWAFVALFAFVRNKGRVGRHLWRFSLWLAVAFTVSLAQPILRMNYPEIYYPLVVATLGAVAIEMFIRLQMLVVIQVEGAKEQKRKEQADAAVRRSEEQLGSDAVDEPSTPG